MFTKWVLCSLALIQVGAVTATQAAESEATKRARVALRGFILHFDEVEMSRLDLGRVAREAMAEHLARQKAGHISRDRSLELCRGIAEKELLEFRKGVIERALADAQSDGVAFDSKERDGFHAETQKLPGSMRQNVEKNFTPLFAEVRQQAVAQQWGRFKKEVFPTEREVEEAAAGVERRRALVNKIVTGLECSANEPVFEENKARLSADVAEPIVADALRQYNAQNTLVQRSDGGKHLVPDMTLASILAELNEMRKKELARPVQKGGAPRHVYQVFPKARSAAQTRADDLAVARFADDLAQRSMILQGTTRDAWLAALEGWMAKAPADHAQKDRSWELLKARHRADFIAAVLRVYRKKITDDVVQRVGEEHVETFLKRLEGMMQKDGNLAEELEAAITRSLHDVFVDARKRITATQLKQHFRPLSEGTWVPREVVPEQMLADRAYVSGSTSIPNPLELPGICEGSRAYRTEELFDETRREVGEAAEAALRQAVRALAKQLDLVRSEAPQFERWAQETYQEGIAPWPNETFLAQKLTDAVKKSWDEIASGSGEMSKTAKTHPDLFKRVRDEIEKEVKAMRPKPKPQPIPHVVARPAEQPPKPAGRSGGVPAKPPGTPSGDGGAGSADGGPGGPFSGSWGLDDSEKDPETPDVVIEVALLPPRGQRREHGKTFLPEADTQVQIQTAGFRKTFVLVEFDDPDLLTVKETALTANLAEQFRAVAARQRRSGKDQPHVFIYCRAEPLVPYGAVSFLRRAASAALARVSSEMTVMWLDEIGELGQPIPKNLRQRSRKLWVAFRRHGSPSKGWRHVCRT